MIANVSIWAIYLFNLKIPNRSAIASMFIKRLLIELITK